MSLPFHPWVVMMLQYFHENFAGDFPVFEPPCIHGKFCTSSTHLHISAGSQRYWYMAKWNETFRVKRLKVGETCKSDWPMEVTLISQARSQCIGGWFIGPAFSSPVLSASGQVYQVFATNFHRFNLTMSTMSEFNLYPFVSSWGVFTKSTTIKKLECHCQWLK